MSRGNLLVGFGAGLLSGLVGAVALLGGQMTPRALAQAPPPAAPRFTLSAWVTTASPTQGAEHGAYVLDTQSGKVWSIVGNQKPVAIVQPE